MKTNAQLREIIRAALDCPSHFHKPTIVNNDDYFSFGSDAIVLCTHCVARMRYAIGLGLEDPVPCHAQFNNRIDHKIELGDTEQHGPVV